MRTRYLLRPTTKLALALLLVATFAAPMPAAQGEIRLLAGTRADVAATIGDGGLATDATLARPLGIFVDSSDNVYIADNWNQRIRRVDAETGLITTIAGNGIPGYPDVGGLATESRLWGPLRVFIDEQGDLYIPQGLTQNIQKIDSASGTVSVIAGNGEGGYSGDGGPATEAKVDRPIGMFVNSAGDLYFADRYNHRIRKVDGQTGIITTVAGTGEAGYSGDGGPATEARLNHPWDVKEDSAGNLYIADHHNGRIRKVDAETGYITTIGGGQPGGDRSRDQTGEDIPATDALLVNARAIAVDAAGNVHVALLGGGRLPRVRRIDAETGLIRTIAGTHESGFFGDGGSATEAALNNPQGVFVTPAGDVYIADTNNNRVRRVDGDTGVITTVAGGGTPDGGSPLNANLVEAQQVAVTPDAMYITDSAHHRVVAIDPSTSIVQTIAGTGESGYSGDGGPASEARFRWPADICLGGSEDLYILDRGNHAVRKVDKDGIITTVAGTGQEGNSIDGGLATDSRLSNPSGIFVDGAGNILIADGTNRVRRVDHQTGILSTVAGTGQGGSFGDGGQATEAGLSGVVDICVDGDGDLYIVEGNHQVRHVDGETGVITRFAGTGQAGFSGDGGPATEAALGLPQDVTADGAGAVYIAAQGNQRVRKVTPDGIMSTVAGGQGPPAFVGVFPATEVNLSGPIGLYIDLDGNLYLSDGPTYTHIFMVESVAEPVGTPGTYAGPTSDKRLRHLGDFRDHAYHISIGGATWADADSLAREWGGYLAVLSSVAEDSFLVENLMGDPGGVFWIGYTDEAEEGQWQWVVDEGGTYENWLEGEPNNENPLHPDLTEFDAAALVASTGWNWSDLPGDAVTFPFIVEIPVTHPPEPGPGKGDVDADGDITSGDAILTLRFAVALDEPTDDQFTAADIDEDQEITAGDAILILRYAVGLIDAFPKRVHASPMLVGAHLDRQQVRDDGVLLRFSVAAPPGVAGGDLVVHHDFQTLDDDQVKLRGIPSGTLSAVHTDNSGQTRVSFLAPSGTGLENQIILELMVPGYEAADGIPVLLTGRLYDGFGAAVGEVGFSPDRLPDTPREFALYQNTPNPFNPTTTIRYDLPAADHVRLTVYGVNGQVIRHAIDGHVAAGRHTAEWDGRDGAGRRVSSGIYLYRIHTESAGFTKTLRMLLLK